MANNAAQIKQQLALQMQSAQQNMVQYGQNAAQNQAAASQLGGQAGTGTTWTTTGNTYPIYGLGGGGGDGVSGGGYVMQNQQPQMYPGMTQQGIFGPYNTSQPSLDFQVDMIFAAVEKHLRKIIQEEIANALRSIHEPEDAR